MKLSDVVSGAGLAFYAEVALIGFGLAFLAVIVWLLWPGRKRQLARDARLPLEDDAGESPERPRRPS